MGIIIDIILLAIVLLSAFLGYKKGLVKLGTKLFAGIIAIVLTIILYKPVSGIIINNTQLDEKIQDVITQNTTNFIEENTQVPNQITSEIINGEVKDISKNIVYVIIAIVLFVFIKIALSIVISLMDVVANLPILKQFNEVGGIIYGLIRGILIVCVGIALIGVFTRINPENAIGKSINNSYLTKIIYENIVKF